MILATLSRLRASLEKRFPERHIYIRTNGEMRGLVLSPGRQMAAAALISGVGLWMGLSGAVMLMAMAADPGGLQAKHAKAYERLMEDSRRHLAGEHIPIMGAVDPVEVLTRNVEKRQEALTKLYAAVTCNGATPPDGSAKSKAGPRGPAVSRLTAIEGEQDRLVNAMDSAAKPCADRIRQSIRVAGLDPNAYAPAGASIPTPAATGSFPDRVARTFADMRLQQSLASAAAALPFARPTNTMEQSSGFGYRRDPINGEAGYHPGLDFPAPRMTPVFSTAPGVVSFVGAKAGYGNVVEVDHGHGLTTRFAHLAAFNVKAGDRVALHQQLGGIGTTGHSTGPHLHYEVLVDGRPQNPEHFLKAGDYVHQGG